ncbi:MAG: glycosyltransferase family 2 protein [Bacteroidota bacterium]
MSETRSDIFVIVPCFNEHPHVRRTLIALLKTPYQIVLIDDGSSPPIYPLVQDLKFHYLRHEENQGQGASLKTGMNYALNKGANLLVHFDADGQHQVTDIELLIAPILQGKTEVTLGSRFLNPHHIQAIPRSRRNLLRMARIFNGLFTGMWLSDAHNGMRAFSRRAAKEIEITKCRMAHATEILGCIKQKGFRYEEVPTHILYPTYARNKGQRAWNSVHILFDLLVR